MRIAIIGIIALAAASAHALTIDDFRSDPNRREISTHRQSGAGEVVAKVDEGLLYRSDPGADGYAVLDYSLGGIDLSDFKAIEVGLTGGPMAVSLGLYGEGFGLAFLNVDGSAGTLTIPLSTVAGVVPYRATGLRLVFDPPPGAWFAVSHVAAVPYASLVPASAVPGPTAALPFALMAIRRRSRGPIASRGRAGRPLRSARSRPR